MIFQKLYSTNWNLLWNRLLLLSWNFLHIIGKTYFLCVSLFERIPSKEQKTRSDSVLIPWKSWSWLFCPDSLKYHNYSALIPWIIMFILPLYPELSCLFCPDTLKYHDYSVLIPWNIMIILSLYPEISWSLLFCHNNDYFDDNDYNDTFKYHDHAKHQDHEIS